jgi:hypothetical protein
MREINKVPRLRRKEARPRSLRRQRDVLCDVMLAAAQCETWLTLHELGRLTGYGEASVSAQLRHLRKPEYGGFVVDKQRRPVDEVARGEVVRGELGLIWEYRMQRGFRIARLDKELVKSSAARRRGWCASRRNKKGRRP